MRWTRPRSRVIGIVLIVIVIAASITLRKATPNQTTRMAIGTVEIIFLAILSFASFGRVTGHKRTRAESAGSQSTCGPTGAEIAPDSAHRRRTKLPAWPHDSVHVGGGT